MLSFACGTRDRCCPIRPPRSFLEESGYLVRERDPGCRRSFHICLTEAGVDEAEKVHQILEFADRQIWKGLSEEEMEQFCSSLEKICDNLENCDTSKGPF